MIHKHRACQAIQPCHHSYTITYTRPKHHQANHIMTSHKACQKHKEASEWHRVRTAWHGKLKQPKGYWHMTMCRSYVGAKPCKFEATLGLLLHGTQQKRIPPALLLWCPGNPKNTTRPPRSHHRQWRRRLPLPLVTGVMTPDPLPLFFLISSILFKIIKWNSTLAMLSFMHILPLIFFIFYFCWKFKWS